MIGKTVGSIRRVSSWVPGGSCDMIWVMAALTCRVALAMSRPQLKLIEMSAAPRLVVERTSTTPGTRRTAVSTGPVTCISICSAGRSPASSDTTTRGKSTVGKSETGRLKAATMPVAASRTIRKRMDRRWAVTQRLPPLTGLPSAPAVPQCSFSSWGLQAVSCPLPHLHAVLQLVVAEHDDRQARIDAAADGDHSLALVAWGDVDAVRLAAGDLKDVGAGVVAQDRDARRRPALVLADLDRLPYVHARNEEARAGRRRP